MTLVEKMCKELGVKVGEEWMGNDGNTYVICNDGSLIDINRGLDCIEVVLNGELKPIWKPEEGEKYYIPDPAYFIEDFRFTERQWNETIADHEYLKNNMVFKTKEEAILVANKMLEVKRKNNMNRDKRNEVEVDENWGYWVDQKPSYKPKIGEDYWAVDFTRDDNVWGYIWRNDDFDNRLLHKGIVFKTKEEAIACAKKMLSAIKEELI